MTITEVRPDILPRLTKASEVTEDRRDAFNAAKETRDALIVEAIDNGISQNTVASAAGISRSLVNKVLLESQPEVLEPADDVTGV